MTVYMSDDTAIIDFNSSVPSSWWFCSSSEIPLCLLVNMSVSAGATQTYRDYVGALCHRNPSLLTLHEFLGRDQPVNSYNTAVLSFTKESHKPTTRSIHNIDDLRHELYRATGFTPSKALDNYAPQSQGQIMIFEDLPASAMERLGIDLDIDPFLLAMHLHTLHRTGSQDQFPNAAALPSRLKSNNYINISYQLP
jgi:hypothetical protein